jgi:phosphopantothenoylcysteine synthetase/decarboxylase
MGKAIFDAVLEKAHALRFITGPAQEIPPNTKGAKIYKVTSTLDMLKAADENLQWADIIISAAAVADFRPARTVKQKIKKSSEIIIKFVKNPDILHYCFKHKKRDSQVFAGFALETENHIKNGLDKLKRKGLDIIVVNTNASFGSDLMKAKIIMRQDDADAVCGSSLDGFLKEDIARKLVDETIRIYKNNRSCKNNFRG